MSLTFILLIVVLILFGVLGHTIWHGGEITIANFLVNLFTGGHAIG